MMLSALAIGLALQTGLPADTDTTIDPVSAYAPVLEHIRAGHPGLPILLNETRFNVDCPPRCGDANAQMHPVEVLEQLRTEGWVKTTCRVQSGPEGCAARAKEHVFVRLGPVIDLPDGARVKTEPDERALDRPDDPAGTPVPVDAAVDVVIHTPCPAPPGTERCRIPDVVSYRYFLQRVPGSCGRYRVVTRMLTGAV